MSNSNRNHSLVNRKPSGFLVYDDTFRVVIVTGFRTSKNRKTGAMLQSWVLVKAHDPVKSVQTGRDVLVCGNCPHRGASCYVDRSRAPLAIWRKYHAGGYPRLTDYSVLNGWNLRIGAYGDPAFVPLFVWKSLVAACKSHTGYTHQWREPWAQGLKGLVMASVDSHQEQIEATSRGWRTFRVQLPGNARFSDEITCPASKEAGERVQCNKCLLCCGRAKGNLKNIVINVHGFGSSKFGKN